MTEAIELSDQEKLLMLDLFRVQEKITGDSMLTVANELYPYLKVLERGIEYDRYYHIAMKSVSMVKEEPTLKSQYKYKSFMYVVKAELGAEFVPSTNLPTGGLLENEAERKKFAVMANTWLGQTRPGMVGKMSAEQICRMITAVNSSLGPRSDSVRWSHVLEKSGLKEQGATADYLRDKYLHLAIMCGIRTVTDYLTYHIDREPQCETLSMEIAKGAITFPQNNELVAPDISAEYVTHFADKDWGKVLVHEFYRVYHDRSNEVGLADKTPEEWKLHFNALRIKPGRTGNQIMTEFYAHVIRSLRAPERFRCEGLYWHFELRVPDEFTMMAIVGAFPNKETYCEEDVYKTFDWLKIHHVLSFNMPGALHYWGDRLFEYLESSDIGTFPGNKRKLGKLKAKWGFH